MHCDDLVGAAEQRQRNGKVEGIGRLEINNQFDRGGLLDGQIARLCPLENLVREVRGAAIHVAKVHSVGHQPAGRRKFWETQQKQGAPLPR